MKGRGENVKRKRGGNRGEIQGERTEAKRRMREKMERGI